ncbi:putative multidrug resistance ABC transporter ATP-binding/permease protein YheI [Planctomycetes bacterium Poly30]|uniref:Putative multidrug resistance ABC transporter ATP-binding/permease protein YheI n=1 Tax=Saltatorellus ferox TaxID=2528018 RepID=A0A518EWK0_9BACT|nr:putative multidrug resistance ABC transporter ATP-binding/permease protein YheI [Planctomycetes bacterium Poly30]
MAILLRFFRRFLLYKAPLLLGLLSIPLAQLADVGITLLVGNSLDRAKDATDAEWIQTVLLWMAVYAVGHCVMRFYQRWLIVVVSRRVEVDLKNELFKKLTSLPFSFHDRSRSGDVVSRLTSDVEAVRMVLGPGIMYTLGALIIVPISLAILFTIQPLLAVLMVLPMFAMGFTMKLLSGRLHRQSTAVQESIAGISHRAQENFGGIRIVKGYSREDQQARLFEVTSAENRNNQIELGNARGLTNAAIHGSFDTTFAVILAVGGIAAVDRTLPVGDLFKFIDLTLKVFWPLIAIGWILGMLPRAVASGERIEELLDEENSIQDGDLKLDVSEIEGSVAFENVSFTYERGTRPALSGISVQIAAGETLGIVGPTGSGKSTLLNLVGRLFEADSGHVLVDDHSVRDLPLDTLRGSLGYVPQDSFLFSEAYDENIRFGADGEISDEEIDRLIERVAMKDEVAEFSEGKKTLVGERGVTLSGGQRQRTCIARALARNPKILVLDDCLSAVDTETERQLLGSLQAAGHGRTVLVAAHRLTTVQRAHKILVLTAEGGVETIGTHEELRSRPGWYADTWEQQQRTESLAQSIEREVAEAANASAGRQA